MRKALLTILLCASVGFPAAVSAAPGPYLRDLYAKRKDLRAQFDPKTFLALPGAVTAASSLEDWARQYGWREDKNLAFYKPKTVIPAAKSDDPAPAVQGKAYVVVDRASGLILAEQDAGTARPIASLTKLMTSEIVLGKKVPLKKVVAITKDDLVGGSALGVKVGTKFTVNDLFYAALLPSANDAANALADSTGLSRAKFVAAMNAKARALGLTRTSFADPTGIDDGNVSTPREFAALVDQIFLRPEIRRYAQTGSRTLTIAGTRKTLTVKSSDALLTKPEYDDILVTAGKTGYLGPEIGWNLAVAMKDAHGHPEVTVVIFGEPKLAQSMEDAEALARWSWSHYAWSKQK